jgi:hypothetical protein
MIHVLFVLAAGGGQACLEVCKEKHFQLLILNPLEADMGYKHESMDKGDKKSGKSSGVGHVIFSRSVRL